MSKLCMLHPMLEALLENKPQQVWEAYSIKLEPTPLEDRFASKALFRLGKLAAARDLALQAQARGEATGVLEEARALVELGDITTAIERLEQTCCDDWNSLDQLFYARELGSLYADTHDKRAILYLEQAWRYSFLDKDCKAFQAGVAQALAQYYDHKGLGQKALHYFSAALEFAMPYRKAYSLIAKAQCETYLGLYSESQKSLALAQDLLELTPAIQPYLAYQHAILARSKGLLADAIKHFLTAAQLSSDRLEYEVTKYAHLGLSAVFAEQANFSLARDHWNKARKYGSDRKFEALASLRLGSLMAAEQALGAKNQLLTAKKQIEKLHMGKELGWSCLHLAQVANQVGDQDLLSDCLKVIADVISQFGEPSQICELNALPEIKVLLSNKTQVQSKIQLFSMGKQQLICNGQPIKFRLARSLEFLVYCLYYPRFKLADVMTEFFPEQSSNLSRGYVHQMRYELERLIPGVRIVLCKSSKMYCLEQSIPIEWDVAEFNQAIACKQLPPLESLLLYTGDLLPNCESQWVRMERENLAWSAVLFGLTLLEDWSKQGEHQKCLELSARLLEINPNNDQVAEYLVRAAAYFKGDARTNYVLKRCFIQVVDKLDELPLPLQQLQKMMNVHLS